MSSVANPTITGINPDYSSRPSLGTCCFTADNQIKYHHCTQIMLSFMTVILCVNSGMGKDHNLSTTIQPYDPIRTLCCCFKFNKIQSMVIIHFHHHTSLQFLPKVSPRGGKIDPPLYN